MADVCATCGHDRAHHDPLPTGAGCLYCCCGCAKFEWIPSQPVADIGCLTCGHERGIHQGANATEWCRIPDCICTKYEAAVPPVLCQCGHDLEAHSGSGVAGIPCKVCGVTDRGLPTGNCMGWWPPGSVTVEASEHGPPIPDLTQAIQAATNALVLASAAGSFPVNNWQVDSQTVARIAVEAAWKVWCQPVSPGEPTVVAYSTSYRVHTECGDDTDRAGINPLQVARDEVTNLEWRLHEANNNYASSRDRLAAIEVYAAELYDAAYLFLQETSDLYSDAELPEVDGPARGHTILQEVQRLQKAAQAVWDSQNALAPTPQKLRTQEWTVVEVGRDAMADLGDALDQAAQRKADR